MDSPRRQRSISLCQPHSTTPHPSRVGGPTRLPDALGCRPSTAGGQGATLSTFPLVPLTREPTCTQVFDPGNLRVQPHPCGHLTAVPEFRASSRLSMVRLPMVGPWFTTPWQLVSQSHGAVACRFRSPFPSHVPFPYATSRHRPIPSVPWTPYRAGLLCGPIPTLILCLYPTGPPATLWHLPTGSSSIRGPFCAPSTGCSLLAPAPFPCAASSAYSPGLLCGPIQSFIPCLYPSGQPATLWRGPTGSSSIRGPFRAPSTGRSLPAPAPLSCAASPAVPVPGAVVWL